MGLDERDIDTLQEMMNIAFGQAAAELADVVDVYVHLRAPRVGLVPITALPDYIRETFPDLVSCSIVEQQFRGPTSGVAMLIFPPGSETQVLSMFPGSAGDDPTEPAMELEREALLEIGNILIGACMGRLFELLDRSVQYFPPRMTVGSGLSSVLSGSSLTERDTAIALQADFGFEERRVSGELIIITSEESESELHAAVGDFWGRIG